MNVDRTLNGLLKLAIAVAVIGGGALAAVAVMERMAAGEFRAGDAELTATLVRSACIHFCHPRLMVECGQDPEPTADQMIDFCLAALA